MGKWKVLALFLVVALVFGAACSGVSSDFRQPTGDLVLYRPNDSTIARAMDAAKRIFESRFPDVTVTYKTFGDATHSLRYDSNKQEEFADILQTELMAGKGPDLVVFHERDFPDLYKVMNSGSFFDLNEFLSEDTEFDTSEFQQAVFNGGIYNGKRLYIPIDYTAYSLGTLTENLEAFGFSEYSGKSLSFPEWSERVIDYVKTHDQTENRSLFFCYRDTFSQLFANYTGLTILDYENLKVQVNSEDFRLYMQFYKAIYPDLIVDWEEFPLIRLHHDGEIMDALGSGNLLYYIDCTSQAYLYSILFFSSRCIEGDNNTAFSTLPTFSGVNPYAIGRYRAAIRSSSPNKVNAYEYLKILLSAQVQMEWKMTETIPINNTIAALNISSLKYDLFERSGDQALINTQEKADALYDQLQTLEYREGNSQTVLDIVYKTMQPWVNDLKSYDECLAELERTLELYLYE